MTEYKDRSDWTSTEASGVTLAGTILAGVAWHWPGTSQDIIGVETEAQTAARLRGYRNFHVTGRGWRDIGYNVAFDQAGRVWMLRSTAWRGNLVGAHCASPSNPDANHEYVGALLILGDSEKPSAAMLAAITDWFWTRFLPGWPGRDDNRGHGQVAGASTTCQGPHVRAALSDGSIPGTEDDDMSDLTPERLEFLLEHTGIDLGGVSSWFGTGIDRVSVAGLLKYSGGEAWEARGERAKILTELAAIRAAVNGEPVDVDELAPALAALVIPPVVAAVGEAGGLSADQVEQAAGRALKSVLGSLDND